MRMYVGTLLTNYDVTMISLFITFHSSVNTASYPTSGSHVTFNLIRIHSSETLKTLQHF